MDRRTRELERRYRAGDLSVAPALAAALQRESSLARKWARYLVGLSLDLPSAGTAGIARALRMACDLSGAAMWTRGEGGLGLRDYALLSAKPMGPGSVSLTSMASAWRGWADAPTDLLGISIYRWRARSEPPMAVEVARDQLGIEAEDPFPLPSSVETYLPAFSSTGFAVPISFAGIWADAILQQRSNPDEATRRLERAAAAGDPEARERLMTERRRSGAKHEVPTEQCYEIVPTERGPEVDQSGQPLYDVRLDGRNIATVPLNRDDAQIQIRYDIGERARHRWWYEGSREEHWACPGCDVRARRAPLPRPTRGMRRNPSLERGATVTLVACSKGKAATARPAKDLYTSPLFRLSRAYAEQLGHPWFILSAAYGLVDPERVLEPYDLKLSDVGPSGRARLGAGVDSQLAELGAERAVVLAGADYVKLLPVWLETEEPLKGLGIGERKRWLKGVL